jgi:hypothetical protein
MARRHRFVARAVRVTIRAAKLPVKVAFGTAAFALWWPVLLLLYWQMLAGTVAHHREEGVPEPDPPRKGKSRR